MHYASRFVDPALGFALGWTYWYDWAIAIATEVVAGTSPAASFARLPSADPRYPLPSCARDRLLARRKQH